MMQTKKIHCNIDQTFFHMTFFESYTYVCIPKEVGGSRMSDPVAVAVAVQWRVEQQVCKGRFFSEDAGEIFQFLKMPFM